MTQNPKSLARKLIVFRACKQYMEQHGHAPTVSEIAELVDIHPRTVFDYMREINGADGLPYEMLTYENASHIGHSPAVVAPRSPDQPTDYYMTNDVGMNIVDGFRILRA
jgi:DNA-directed RNA polymerase specialized sigma subunit